MRFRFADVVVDEDARRMQRAGSVVHVSPKAFDLLCLLVRERPSVVAKEAIHAALWPDTFVSDTSLATLVTELRSALGESAREARIIRTAHRRGYAFEADVAVDGSSLAPPASSWLHMPGGDVPLPLGRTVIGRDSGADVRLHSPSVSRLHAALRIDASGATIVDLHSKNGTFVRGHRIESETELGDGDEVRLGSFKMTFRSEPAYPTLTEGGR